MLHRRNPPHLRRFFAFLLLTTALLFSGCVYLRLLDLKKQLSHFDAFFKTETASGVRIECLKPLLLSDDVRWLGVFPETITTSEEGMEIWRVRWLKEPPPGPPETAVYDVELTMRFTEDRVAFVSIPERYFEFFPKELFVNLLRSTGSAQINRSSRSADVESAPPSAEIRPPTMESIGGMLGRPNEHTRRDGLDIYRYRYRAVTPEKKAKPIEVTFTFDPVSSRMQTLVAKLPTGTINYRLTPSKP